MRDNHAGPPPEQNVSLGMMFLFSEIIIGMGISALVKQISGDVSFFVIMFYRYLASLPLLFLLGWHQRQKNLLQVKKVKTLVARIIMGTFGLSAWFNAVIYLPLSVATVLAQTMAIFITVMAPFILGERVGAHRIGAVLIGFAGVVLLINPFSEADSSPLWGIGFAFGIATPFFGALMFIFLRKLGQTEAPISTTLWYNITGTIIFFVIAFTDGPLIPQNLTEKDLNWFVMILIGVASSAQQFLMAKSHQLASATVLAPVHYTAVPISIFIGVIFFNEVITLPFLTGTSVIIGSTWYILQREKIRKAENNN